MEFHKGVAYNFSGRSAFVLGGVGYGYATESVWALVFATLASQPVSTVTSYFIHSYRPRPQFDRGAASELFDYGKWVFGSEGLTFLINEGDDAFVGWALGSYALGVYQLAYRISNAPTTEITHPIQRLRSPPIRKFRETSTPSDGGASLLYASIRSSPFPPPRGSWSSPRCSSLWFSGRDGGNVVVPMQPLAAYASLRSSRSATVPLFRAIGRPDLDTEVRLLKLALLVPPLYPAAQRFGLPGVAAAVLGHAVIAAPVASYLAVESVGGDVETFTRALSYSRSEASSWAVVFLVCDRLGGLPPVAELILLVVLGVVAYGVLMLSLERQFGIGLTDIYATIQRASGGRRAALSNY